MTGVVVTGVVGTEVIELVLVVLAALVATEVVGAGVGEGDESFAVAGICPINLLSILMNPHTEDMSIAKSERPNVMDKFGVLLLGK